MHVLLALHDVDVRDGLRDVLLASGHTVSSASRREDAIAAIERDAPPLIVVADDLGGVAGEGLAVCHHARAQSRPDAALFVLMVTTDEEPGRLASVLDAGADDFLLTVASRQGLRERLFVRTAIAVRRIAEDAARRNAEAALARSQRQRGIGEALAALQHEINNPLAALLAHAGLLEHGLYDPGEERELLAIVVEQAHRIAEVVKRMAALRYPDAAEYMLDPAGLLDPPEPSAGEGPARG